MMCEDIFGCDHRSETPIVDHLGEIVHWRCRCGRITPAKKAEPHAYVPSVDDHPVCERCGLGYGAHELT